MSDPYKKISAIDLNLSGLNIDDLDKMFGGIPEPIIPHVDPSRLEKLQEGVEKPVTQVKPIPPVKPIHPPSQLIRDGQMPRDKPSQFIRMSGEEKYKIAVNLANELLSDSEQLTKRYIENEEFIVSLLNLPWYKNFFIKNKILNYMRHINDTYRF